MIVYGWTTRENKLCQKCNTERLKAAADAKPKKEQKPRKPLKRTPLKKKPTSRRLTKAAKTKEVNKAIWAERPHVCIECDVNLPDHPDGIFFSHLHSQGSHPAARHDPANIVIHCPDCHRRWEFEGGRGDKMPKTLELFLAYNPNFLKDKP